MPTRTHLASFFIMLLVVIGLFSYARHARIVPQAVDVPAVATTTAVQSAPRAGAALAPASPHVPSASAPVPAGNATLAVGTTTYPVNVTPGETVIDAMNALMAEGKLAFTGRDYPGMGFFVDSINGQGSAGGKYWMLYINGVSATSGASATVMHAGDTAEWRYEQGY